MRKHVPPCVFLLILVSQVQAQSIDPTVINSTGGSFQIPASNFVLDWNVGEMTLVNTSTGVGSSGIYIVTNGFLQPTKYGHVKDDKQANDVLTRNEKMKPGKESVDMMAFPNPVVNYVDVKVLVSDAHAIKFTLFNQVGQTMYMSEKNISGAQKPERISMAGLTSGTYLLYVECFSPDGKTIRTGSFKIVKAN